jgi:hypothetical protein
VTLNDQWHRISFRKGELVSGTMGRFFMDSLLPATEALGRNKRIDLSTVAIFGVDDSEGGRYAVYFSPGAFSEFTTLALAHGARPSDRPAVKSAFLLYGDERSARRLLTS